MNWVRRTENLISTEFLRDEAEIRRVEARFHAHTLLLAVAVIVCSVLYTIGAPDQMVVFFTWFVTGCQEYTDYLKRF